MNINKGSKGSQPSDEGALVASVSKMAKPLRQIVKPLSSHFGCLCFPQWLFSVKAVRGCVSVTAESFCQQTAILHAIPTPTHKNTHMNEHNKMACMRLKRVPFCIVKPLFLARLSVPG